jgi:hypothetical protein
MAPPDKTMPYDLFEAPGGGQQWLRRMIDPTVSDVGLRFVRVPWDAAKSYRP